MKTYDNQIEVLVAEVASCSVQTPLSDHNLRVHLPQSLPDIGVFGAAAKLRWAAGTQSASILNTSSVRFRRHEPCKFVVAVVILDIKTVDEVIEGLPMPELYKQTRSATPTARTSVDHTRTTSQHNQLLACHGRSEACQAHTQTRA